MVVIVCKAKLSKSICNAKKPLKISNKSSFLLLRNKSLKCMDSRFWPWVCPTTKNYYQLMHTTIIPWTTIDINHEPPMELLHSDNFLSNMEFGINLHIYVSRKKLIPSFQVKCWWTFPVFVAKHLFHWGIFPVMIILCWLCKHLLRFLGSIDHTC